MSKLNIVSGVTGQDGSYLVELLHNEDDIVIGLARSVNTGRDLGCLSSHVDLPYYVGDSNVWKLLDAYKEGIRIFVLDCDISSQDSIKYVFESIITPLLGLISKQAYLGPDVKKFDMFDVDFNFYHMAALSHVHESYYDPEKYIRTNTLGTYYLFKSFVDLFKHFDALSLPSSKAFFYHAATTELFSGDPDTVPQNSKTRLEPQSPYAVSKLAAFNLLRFQLEHLKGTHNIYLRQGILSNHESPRRPVKFVTQKIIDAIARYIKTGIRTSFGNINARRDWGYSKDFMEAVIKMMDKNSPEVLVIGTGVQHSVKDFMQLSLDYFNFARGLNLTIHDVFNVNEGPYVRQREVHSLCIDPSEAKKAIGWEAKVQLRELIQIMADEKIKEYGI